MMAFGTPDRVQDLLHSQLKVLTPYTITDPGRLSQQLARARREGVAYENEEAVLGNACVAAPIFNSAALPTAAVSVAGPPLRLRAEQRAPLVRRAAASITSRIGGRLPDGWRLASAPVISEQQIALLSGSRPRACPARRTRR
jgi:DNA-binding IclR family transcriptional regulator